MTPKQAQLLSVLRLDLGAMLRGYFSYETTMMLRDKLTNLIRDEAGAEIAMQPLRKISKANYAQRRSKAKAE